MSSWRQDHDVITEWELYAGIAKLSVKPHDNQGRSDLANDGPSQARATVSTDGLQLHYWICTPTD